MVDGKLGVRIAFQMHFSTTTRGNREGNEILAHHPEYLVE